MARRKRQFEDDSSDSSGEDGNNSDDFIDEDADARAERKRFEDPYQRKRRKASGEEEDDEDAEGFGSRGKTRVDWTKAPAFVSGEGVNISEELEQEPDSDANSSSEEESDESIPAAPDEEVEQRMEEDEEAPVRSGLGARGGIGAKSGIGAGGGTGARGGIGSRSQDAPPNTPAPPQPGAGLGASRPGGLGFGDSSLPASFGGAPQQRSFLRGGGAQTSTKATPNLSASERHHFNTLAGSFGARMMAKMGWELGSGLGAGREGIVTPVETKSRPVKRGIAFGGFKERTEQAKTEARRRGEAVSDDEDTKRTRRKAGGPKVDKAEPWKKPRKSKVVTTHKTYEEIIAEVGLPAPGIGKIIDATGATLREVSSLADVSASWSPTKDPMRIPEIRHNVRLIMESAKTDVDGLAREAKTIQERKKWVHDEDIRLRKKVADEAEIIARLQQIHLVLDEINSAARQIAKLSQPSLELLHLPFEKLATSFQKEQATYRLDEMIVAAMAPTVRRLFASWQPLDDCVGLSATFRQWRSLLAMTSSEHNGRVDVYGTVIPHRATQVEVPMTPYESLMWTSWLPRIRSCINNDWSASDAQPAVQLYEAWSDLLPAFIRDNFFDQLVLPKIHKAVADWNPKRDNFTLEALVFPWLPHVGLRMESLVGDARLKVKKMLRSWNVDEGVPKGLLAWKGVFDAAEWDSMLLKYVVPKLGATLRDDFKVNPRKQVMDPLTWVFPWHAILRASIFGQLFETEFFPKWLNVLHIWLVQPSPNLEEVAQWYEGWKSFFPREVSSMPAIADGFTRGLQLMDQAIKLGLNARTQLRKPEYPGTAAAAAAPSTAKKVPMHTEVTFRSLVEERASRDNLLLIATNQTHPKSRKPLFRVSLTVEGKSGLYIYLSDDAVWAAPAEGEEYRAISLEDMVARALRIK